jgi:chemotaxis protein MotB
MAEDIKSPIVVKKIKIVAGGHHGGAWKIAYADFVTAMMAFFLLMWLLGSSSQGDLQGIAEYFQTPLKVALQVGSGAGASNSILQGGGKTLTLKVGQDRATQEKPVKQKKVLNRAQKKQTLTDYEMLKKEEVERLKELEKRLKEIIESHPNLNKYKNQILVDITTDGLRLQIVDEKNRPMFLVSKAELEPHAKEILKDLGKVLNSVPNKVNISGHTDARPFNTNDKFYGNWELSAERALAARRELIAGGMKSEKVLQVEGLSSAVLFDKSDPFNPVNRRIAIIVLNMKAEARVMGDTKMLEIINSADANSAISDLDDETEESDSTEQTSKEQTSNEQTD